jgi:hypothetical protein
MFQKSFSNGSFKEILKKKKKVSNYISPLIFIINPQFFNFVLESKDEDKG